MTIRGSIKVFISILGVCLMLALWHSGASLDAHGGWYLLALLMAVSGALPKEVAMSAALCCLVLLGNAVMRPGMLLLGLGLPHACFCGVLALANFFLAQETEAKIMRCVDCYWHGPSTRVHFGRCPKCGHHSLKDDNQTVLIHS